MAAVALNRYRRQPMAKTVDRGSVTLRPVEQADLTLLDHWRRDLAFTGTYNHFLVSYRQRGRSQDLFDVDGMIGENEGTLLVCIDGTPVGAVEWHLAQYGPTAASRAFNLGIAIIPSARGRGVGSRAQEQLADFLFAHTAVHRLEATTDVTNMAEQRALEKAGFLRDGVLRGAQFRLGGWHDMAQYSRLRTDPAPQPATS